MHIRQEAAERRSHRRRRSQPALRQVPWARTVKSPRCGSVRACTTMRGVLMCACVTLLGVLVLTGGEERTDMSPVPFVMGSRYGRSPARLITPRNDSRYGKRSDAGREVRALVCEYTGVGPLYRCVNQNRRLYDKRSRSSEDVERGEQG
ncbi:uncharacterized protein LOC101742726 isoform X2 [Bombyx mori]